ncbi:MAG: TIGR04076 family protein [bacterium]|nr:TIGR04076 family protein [bacterium]
MRRWFAEPCQFRVTILEVGPGGDPEHRCRAGHEPGDVYEFSYCTPGGLCGEIFYRLFPILHTFRTEADMRWNFGWQEADRHLMWCPAREVRFELRRLSGDSLALTVPAEAAERVGN